MQCNAMQCDPMQHFYLASVRMLRHVLWLHCDVRASLERRALVDSSVARLCVVSPATPVSVFRAALLRSSVRKPSSSGFSSSSDAWFRAQAQLFGVAMSAASSQGRVLLPRASIDVIFASLTAASSLLAERSASVDNILGNLAAANSLLTEGMPFVPKDRQRKSTDETVSAFEYLEFQEEAEHQELRKGKHGDKDTRKGRSKGRPRDIASRSRSGDRRGQRQGGPCGSRSCLPRKGKDKGRGKSKDAPLPETPCY